MIIKNLYKINSCPICKSKRTIFKGLIRSKVKVIDNYFSLKLCKNCNHRFLSKFPKIKYLNNLYKKNSNYVFGHDVNEESHKKDFKKNGFKDVISFNQHWMFKYIDFNNIKEYLEIGPGLCRMYKTFHEKGSKCNGIDLQPFIKAPGIVKSLKYIKKNTKNIAVAFDVIEHTTDPIELLKNINNKMKIGGLIFLTFPNADSYKSRLLNSRWNMVAPLAHINFFSKKSCELALNKSNFELIHISSFSLVEPKRLIKNLIKLPARILVDIFKLDINSIFTRICEFSINILDLMHGDQMKVVAIKKKRIK